MSYLALSWFSLFAIYGFIFDLFNVKRTYVLCTSIEYIHTTYTHSYTQHTAYSSKSMSILCLNIHFIEGEPCIAYIQLCYAYCRDTSRHREMNTKNKRNGRNRRVRENEPCTLIGGRYRNHIMRFIVHCECIHSVFFSARLLSLIRKNYACIMMYRIIEIYLWEVHTLTLTHPKMCHMEFDTVRL